MSKNLVLEIKDFSLTFKDQQVLNSTNFSVLKGEFCILTGQSGSGKTMTLRSICKLFSGYSGSIKIEKIENNVVPSFVFQSSQLIPWLSILENMLLCFPNRKAEALHWLNRMGLSPFMNQKPHEISGGMRQKAALARAVMFNPNFIILDEPFSSLDFPEKYRLQILLQELWLENGSTIIFATHDLQEALFLGQKIFLFEKKTKKIKEVSEFSLPFPRNHQSLNIEKKFVEMYSELSKKLLADSAEDQYAPEA
jgi:NitT/TauT family transport system ATP-binding protein